MFFQWRVVSCVAAVLIGLASVASADGPPDQNVATVNGQAILSRDLDLELLVSGRRGSDRQAALDRVIDRTLIAGYLQKQKTQLFEEDVEGMIERVRAGVQSGGETLEVVLKRLDLTEEDLRKTARASVAWESYVLRTITQKELQAHFEAHRAEFDGTRLHLRQIVRSLSSTAPAADWDAAEKQLSDLRTQINSGQIDFPTAAMKHSTSPSGKSGGDLGFVKYSGDLPAPVATAAFALSDGEISQPIRSQVGVHLVQVIERKPGDLSLEDARPELLKSIGEQLWVKTVTQLRSKAKITIVK